MKCLFFHASIVNGKSREEMCSELIKMLEKEDKLAFNNVSYAELNEILHSISQSTMQMANNAFMGMPAGGMPMMPPPMMMAPPNMQMP